MPGSRCRFVVVALAYVAFAVAASGQNGTAEGTFTVDGEAINVRHVTVHEQESPMEEGETSILITLSDHEIPYLEVDSMCPGPYGAHSLQLQLDKDQQVFSTNFCFAGGNMSGKDFGVELESFGPREYSGRLAAEFEVFDQQVTFDLRFVAPLPEELPGEVLPAGGGEPGAAYLAWQKAVQSGDLEKIKELLPQDRVAEFESMPPEEQKENIEFIQMMAPEDIEVLGGRQVGDLAYLAVKATMDGEPVEGEIKLEKMSGIWVAVEESWSS